MNVEPLNAVRLISPRVVALVSTKNKDSSTNASPYSWVFPFSFDPPMVAVGVGKGGKNTQKNAEREHEFVVNLVSSDLGQKACDLEREKGSKQLENAGLNEISSREVKTAGIREAKVRIECRLVETVDVEKADHVLLVGEIVAAECDAMLGNSPDLDKLDLLMHVSGPEFRKVGEKVELERRK